MDREQHIKEIARFTAELCGMHDDGECLIDGNRCADYALNLEVAGRAYDSGIRASDNAQMPLHSQSGR